LFQHSGNNIIGFNRLTLDRKKASTVRRGYLRFVCCVPRRWNSVAPDVRIAI
jgi:hypothetical protein